MPAHFSYLKYLKTFKFVLKYIIRLIFTVVLANSSGVGVFFLFYIDFTPLYLKP